MAWLPSGAYHRRSPRDRWYITRMLRWGNTGLHKHVRIYPVTFQIGCTYLGTLPLDPNAPEMPNHHTVPQWQHIVDTLHLLTRPDTFVGDIIRI
jgi:hypothetical protein